MIVLLDQEGTPASQFCYSSYMNQKFEISMMKKERVLDSSMTNLALDLTDEEQKKCTEFLTALEGRASYDYMDAMIFMPMAPKVYVMSLLYVFSWINDDFHFLSMSLLYVFSWINDDFHFLSMSLLYVCARIDDDFHFLCFQNAWKNNKTCNGSKISTALLNTLVDDKDCSKPDEIKKVFCSQSVVLMLRYALDPEGQHSGLLQTMLGLNSRLVSPKQVEEVLKSYGAVSITNEELEALSLVK